MSINGLAAAIVEIKGDSSTLQVQDTAPCRCSQRRGGRHHVGTSDI